MKLAIVNKEKKKVGEKNLPSQFDESYRPDLIKRAVHALQSAARQVYGASPGAGLVHSTKVSKRRRDYRGCYGFGISRVARKIHSRRGTRMSWIGAFSPQTRGGRRAHPPKADKLLTQKINAQEKNKALRSALSASLCKEIIKQRGHFLPDDFPFILDSSFEDVTKTEEVKQLLTNLGFAQELERAAVKKIRAGKGKMRGRRYRLRKGPLFVVSGKCALLKSGNNLPGVEIVEVKALNAELLAPGTQPGRIALWTEKAVEVLEKEKLFAQ